MLANIQNWAEGSLDDSPTASRFAVAASHLSSASARLYAVQISEPMLRNLLEQVSAKTEQKTKIVFNTRRAMMDSDSDSD